jgi:AraC-like DNA-binding protein
MASVNAVRPVRRSELSTRDEEEAQEFCRVQYGVGTRARFGVSEGEARFCATAALAEGIAASQVLSTAVFSAATDPFGSFLSVAVLGGRMKVRRGRDETVAQAAETIVYPLGVPLEMDLVGASVRSLQLPAARIAAVAEETAGIRAADLRFQATTPVSAARADQWLAFMDLASGILLAENSPARHPLIAEELARTAAVIALDTFPSTALTASYQPGPGWVPPRAVRKAAAFIEAHAGQPVTVEEIAAAAGVGARALQYAFRRNFGTTPMGYLRRIRLDQAAKELRGAGWESGLTVAEVAHRWGWASSSQFSAAYQRRFGVLPSQTLRQ